MINNIHNFIATTAEMAVIITVLSAIFVYLFVFIMFVLGYKKCPPDKVMVIYGKVGKNPDGTTRSFACVHGGGKIIWPLIQRYEFLDLSPIVVNVDLRVKRMGEGIDFKANFAVAVSTENGVLESAVQRLVSLSQNQIRDLANDIITGQIRHYITQNGIMDTLENIQNSTDDFLNIVAHNVEDEIKKIGLRLVSVNILDTSAL